MTIYELNENEMYELKEKLYYHCDEMAELNEAERYTVDEALTPEDIPDKIVYKAFGMYSFVEEDFFCNI